MNWLFRLGIATGLALLPCVAAAQKVGPNQASFVMGNATGGNQGYGTINAEGLFVNGVSVGSGGGGCTNNCTFTGTTTTEILTSSQGITDTSTAGINTTGALVFGTNSTGGAPGTNGGILNNQDTYTYAATTGSGGAVRQRDMGDTINVVGTATGVDEGLVMSRTYQGSGAAVNAETNGFHVYMQSNAGLTMAQLENIETSTLFNGTHTVVDSALLLQHYSTTGTLTGQGFGIQIGLTNDNTTAGSIANFYGLYMGAMSGAGTKPTDYFFAFNGDSSAATEVLGKMSIGFFSNSAGIPAWLTVKGPDTGATVLAEFESSAANVLTIQDNGTFIATGNMTWNGNYNITGTITAGGLSAGTQVSCLGLSSGSQIVTAACGGGGGGGIATVTDGTTTVTSPTTLTFNSGFVTNGGSGNAQYQAVSIFTITSSQTFTPPANAKLYRIIAVGQGGCGGGGAGVTASISAAGGGGGGGAMPKDSGWFPAAQLTGNAAITIGTACTAASGGTAGGNGGNGSVGGNATVNWSGMDIITSYGGGGGAGAAGGATDTATGGGGGASMAAAGTSSTNGTGGNGGGGTGSGQIGGSGVSGGSGSTGAAFGGAGGGGGASILGVAGSGGRNPSGANGGGSGGGCNVGAAVAGGSAFSPMNQTTVNGGAATGANGSTGTTASGYGMNALGGGGGSGGGGGTSAGGVGGNGGVGGGGGGGGGSGCGGTGGNGGVGDGPRVIIEVL